MVITQSFWVGVLGLLSAVPICAGIWYGLRQINQDVDFRWQVVAGTAAITLGMAVLAGITALRSVRQIEPMELLR
jgi:putative ABC transport system permease protein